MTAIYLRRCDACGSYIQHEHFDHHLALGCASSDGDVAVAPAHTFERWVEHFWSRVRRGDPSTCWPWLNARNSTGFGVLGVPKRFREQMGSQRAGQMLAHRVAWVLANGKRLPLGAFICHRCDSSFDCCNPAHLYLGNHHENCNDEAVKRRRAKHELLSEAP